MTSSAERRNKEKAPALYSQDKRLYIYIYIYIYNDNEIKRGEILVDFLFSHLVETLPCPVFQIRETCLARLHHTLVYKAFCKMFNNK